jgi:tRNA-2-methylthio-N6-dimethylallyladenosine synthase
MGDSVPEETKIQRLNDIIDLQRAISFRRNQVLIGSKEEVLIEGPSRKSNTDLVGRTDSNRMVVFPQEEAQAGEYRHVRIERANSATLFGTIAHHSAEQRVAVNG